MSSNLEVKSRLIQAWTAGVESVVGKRVTSDAFVEDRIESITHLLAVGKAASSMCVGALDSFAEKGRALVITKYDHSDDVIVAHPGITTIESGHPVPDINSLRAGRAMDQFIHSIPPQEQLVMLVSGGASALAEVLPDAINLERLQQLTAELLADGCSIDQINAVRTRLSCIKGGKLLSGFGGNVVRVYAISDVPGDSIDLIGSGIGSINTLALQAYPLSQKLIRLINQLDPNQSNQSGGKSSTFDYYSRVIGSNHIARQGAAKFLLDCGMQIVINEESLNHDIHTVAQQIAATLLVGPPGAYIWGGESTVILPPKPGVGGRNQSLALALAKEIRGHRTISALVAGTDGSDGPTTAAGGLIDGDTFDAASAANNALLKADAGTYLARLGALFKPGPTGTNVMDLAIAIKQGVQQ